MRVHDVFHVSLLKPYVTDEMFTYRNDSLNTMRKMKLSGKLNEKEKLEEDISI